MIFGIELVNILIWIAICLLIGGVLPVLTTFFAPMGQIASDIGKNSFSSSGARSGFRKIGKNLLYSLSGAAIALILYRLISGDNYQNYSTDGYFWCLVGSLWLLIAMKFTEFEKK